MKKFPLYIVSALLLSVVPVSLRGGELTGQIFIVTNAHESKKLGLVAVAVFEEKAIAEAIASVKSKTLPDLVKLQKMMPGIKDFRQKATDANFKIGDQYMRGEVSFQIRETSEQLEKEALKIQWDAQDYLRYLLSARRFFKELPAPIAMTKTDADGNFSMEIPEGQDLVVGAAATRDVFDKTESYHWLLRVPKELPAKITLSNDNLTSAGGNSILVAGSDDGRDLGSADEIASRLRATSQKISAWVSSLRAADKRTRSKKR